MRDLNYVTGRFFGRLITGAAVRMPSLNRSRFDAMMGGFVVAPTHESHFEPVLLSAMLERKIDWMARLEFFRHPVAARTLHLFDAFPVNRCGVPVRAIREAITRVQDGRVVGIFPEGGVARGGQSCTRGGPFKLGACVVAIRANVPIMPVVMLNTHSLVNVGPWIPFGRARVWVNFGHPIYPPRDTKHRPARQWMGEQLRQAYGDLYRELCDRYQLHNLRVEAYRDPDILRTV